MTKSLNWDPSCNTVELGDNVEVVGMILGTGNVVKIAGTRQPQTLRINIVGNNNRIVIGSESLLSDLKIDIGSKRWKSSECVVDIGDWFSIAKFSRFVLPNSASRLKIGAYCMFSNSIIIRSGEYPHLLFDMDTNAYLDVSNGISIGDHCWIGEGAYFTKSASLGNDCIVGARSVVTKAFSATNVVIAGNPAKVVRERVQWIANELLMDHFPDLKRAFKRSRVNQINKANRQRAIEAPSDAATKA